MDRDLYYLHKALLLAKKGIYSVNPNPAVGAIVVKNEKIIGMGYHNPLVQHTQSRLLLKKLGITKQELPFMLILSPVVIMVKLPHALI